MKAGWTRRSSNQFRPIWTPPHEATARAAWDGSYPDQPEVKIHVEAAAFEGKPVYFEILDVWDQPLEVQLSIARFRQRALIVLLLAVFIIVMLGSALLALRNLKLGRGDRKGAFRLAAFVLAVFFLRWLFTSHHVATEEEVFNFIYGVQNMLFWTFFFWVVYLAFEPFVRRRWPGRIISWSRCWREVFAIRWWGATYSSERCLGWAVILCQNLSRQSRPTVVGLSARYPVV